jgi:ABC-type multidrug transport system fused ATPase/permease subunit
VIKSCDAEDDQQRRFEADSRGAFDAAFQARYNYMLFGVLMFWIAGSALILSFVFSSVMTSQGTDVFAQGMLGLFGFSIWNYGLFMFARHRIAQGLSSVKELMRWWGRAQDIAVGLDRVFEMLNLSPELCDAHDAVNLKGISDGISCNTVSFAYEPGRPVLKDIDFVVRTGTLTAIVGPTGSGKSTLMSLLLRNFDPDQGSIEIDGRDMRSIKLDSLRKAIAVSLQEPFLFATTVSENIRFAVPNASEEQVRAAARVATADRFIETLPRGYDTMLGERGIRLSTGERHRISISRAILKDTSLIIFDEPTAALDPKTEILLLRNLSEWKKDRVVFLTTHRLSTMQYADQILYLHDGQTLEFGTHADLMACQHGAYRHLVEREAGRQALQGTTLET